MSAITNRVDKQLCYYLLIIHWTVQGWTVQVVRLFKLLTRRFSCINTSIVAACMLCVSEILVWSYY